MDISTNATGFYLFILLSDFSFNDIEWRSNINLLMLRMSVYGNATFVTDAGRSFTFWQKDRVR